MHCTERLARREADFLTISSMVSTEKLVIGNTAWLGIRAASVLLLLWSPQARKERTNQSGSVLSTCHSQVISIARFLPILETLPEACQEVHSLRIQRTEKHSASFQRVKAILNAETMAHTIDDQEFRLFTQSVSPRAWIIPVPQSVHDHWI
jgi:hypothetical protein